MFPKWRLILRKAEHALKTGHLTEACQLATSPEVRSFRPARNLVRRVAEALAERAERSLELGDSPRAWNDLLQAGCLGGPEERLGRIRQELVRRGLEEARTYLESAQPATALRCLGTLARNGAASVELERLQQAGQAWHRADEQARRGHFRSAVELLQGGRALVPDCAALESRLREVETAKEQIAALEAQLHQALSKQEWERALTTATELLAIAPNHAPARTARRRAWEAVGAKVSSHPADRYHPAGLKEDTSTGKPGELAEPSLDQPDFGRNPQGDIGERTMQSFLLWVDAVGGYLVCPRRRISLGQPVGPHVDVPILAELSRLHAWIERDSEGYLLRANRQVVVRGKEVAGETVLLDGDLIRLGEEVWLRFRQPNPLSATARLELVSPHRFSLGVDAVIVMAEACVLGPKTTAHVVAPEWEHEVILHRQGDELWCRMPGPFEVDANPCYAQARLSPASRITAEGLSFALEPVRSYPKSALRNPVSRAKLRL